MNKNININYYNILTQIEDIKEPKLFDFDEELKSLFKNRISKYECDAESEADEPEIVILKTKPREMSVEELREKQKKEKQEEEIKRAKRIEANKNRAIRKASDEKQREEKIKKESKRYYIVEEKTVVEKKAIVETKTVKEFDKEEIEAVELIFFFYYKDMYNTFVKNGIKKIETDLGIYLSEDNQEKIKNKNFDITISLKQQIVAFIEELKIMNMESIFVYRMFALIEESELYELRMCNSYENYNKCYFKYRYDFDSFYEYVDFFYPKYIDSLYQENKKENDKKETVCKQLRKGICTIENCKYAHNIEEYEPVSCSYGHDCKFMMNKHKPCKFRHPDESKLSILKRLNMKFPEPVLTPTPTPTPTPVPSPSLTSKSWGIIVRHRSSSFKDIMEEQSRGDEGLTLPPEPTSVLNSERTKAFEVLTSKNIVPSITKTKLCNNTLCDNRACTFAHHFNEMAYCIFGESCKKMINGKPCMFRHVSETADEFSTRTGIAIPMDKPVKKEEHIKCKRTQAFEMLSSDNLSKAIVKTKLCNYMMDKGCTRPACKFAHHFNEMAFCAFGETCKFKDHNYKPCLFRHAGETSSEFSTRTGIHIPKNMM
jgi:hypothetical protein